MNRGADYFEDRKRSIATMFELWKMTVEKIFDTSSEGDILSALSPSHIPVFHEVIMSEATIPESRDYRHIKCGTITTISGQPFEVMSNPLSDMSRTWCSGCSSMFTLDEYEWADSGESIPAYYSRHSAKATSFQKFLCSRMNMLVMGGLGLLLGAIGGFLVTRNGAIGAKIIVALVGGGIGGFAGLAIYVSVICNLVTKSVCGVADTRTLK